MASRKFLVPANLLNLAEDPASGTSGDIYFNTTSDKLKIYDGTVWVEVGAGGGSAITVSETAPVSPTIGDAWYQNTTGSFYVYDGSFWVEVNGVVASESFKTISVSGQSDIVADGVTDTLTFIAGTNVSIETNATNDSITINSTGDYTSVDSITYPDYITFDTTPETIPTAPGSLFWDSGDGLPATVLNANVSIGLGQEQVALVKNATGSSIAKGKVVYISGAQGQRPTITLSDADTETTSSKTFGVTAEAIADGAEGFVTTFGVLRGVNTDGLTEGAPIWLSTTAGNFTTSVPEEPAHSVFIGYVVKAHESSGEIFVNIQNGYELTELHGVVIENDGALTDNEVLAYDTASGLWKNQTSVEAGLLDTSATAQTKSGDLTLTGKNSIYDGREYLYAVNDELDTVSKLSAVFFNGVSLDGTPKFKLADLTYISQPGVVGLTTEDILAGQTGTIITRGIVDGVDTSAYSDGIILYVSTSGTLTDVRPTGADSRIHKIAKVVIADETDGKIYVFGNIEEDLPNLEEGKVWIGNSSDQPQTSILDTSLVPEGISLYFTDQRAIDALTVTLGDYLTEADALSTYLTQSDAVLTYQPLGSYLTTETDPIFTASEAFNITATDTTNWNSAYTWGDHSLAGYALDTHNHTVDSLSNVVITGTPTDGQALVWDTTTSKWINETVVQDLSSYLTISSAASTYQPIGSYLTSESDTLSSVTGRGATTSDAITITNADASSSPTTGALIVTGGVGIGEDLYVNNDIYVGGNINITGSITGDLTSVDVTNLVVTDPLIYLAEGNPDDSVDIGIFAALNHGGPSYSHAGLIRDASDSGKWKLASGLSDPTSNVIDFTSATFDTLKLGTLEATSVPTVGTITSGVWNGTEIGYAYGGTGLTTLGTAGQALKVNATADGLEWGDAGGAGGLYVSNTAPPSPTEGIGWYNNETGKLFVFDGTYWVEATNNLTDEDIMDTVAQMVADGTHSNIDITYNDLSNSLSFNVLSEPITDFLTLNEDLTGTPTGNAGIIVNRGDLTDVSIRFNETEDAWEYTNDGVEYQAIGSGGGAVSTSTALSNSFWLGA